MTAEPAPYLIVPASDEHRAVDLWSSVRLPFEPKGWVHEMRNELRVAVSALTASPDEVLQATYVSTENGLFDLENVLFYNVGSDCFFRSAQGGVRFERAHVRRMPGNATAPLVHFHQYAPVPREGAFLNWRLAASLARWRSEIPPLSGSTKAGAVWLAMKRGRVESAVLPDGAVTFGLSLKLSVPQRSPISVTAVVKPLLDGVVSAFHAHDGTDLAEVAARLATLGIAPQEAASLLTDPRHAVLGARRLLWLRSEGVQWNPADDALVACELLVERSSRWRLTGELLQMEEIEA
jgi:hypothetical protein